ncbi:MAG: MBL fold metallo-hydrolase [Theionarchaea archaeon]|nr:MBL fold metallo-hydrolase [Theionarchaea archaeon]MBU7020331.1 MBL fold metallo-hydrolase [Theionarchaea archaeon]MBU7034822.1 MBL fold metallo-hydrolase [Theionarchaea archaeon]MBU7040265.1 MBL fold metallo-hydrolase [Theionarchaea archaeon]
MSVSIKLLAHAAFQIRGGGKIIYTDLEEYSDPVEKADIILVTHSHTDHCDPAKINRVRSPSTVIIAPEDCRSKIRDITPLKPGESMTINGIKVKAVHAYNYKRFRSPGKPYHPKGMGVGYLISVEGKTIYHAGDTDFIPEMKELGTIDVALLPTGDTYTMDVVEGAEAALTISPHIAIPMHTWGKDTTEFKKRVEAGSSTRVVVLKEGEEYHLD